MDSIVDGDCLTAEKAVPNTEVHSIMKKAVMIMKLKRYC